MTPSSTPDPELENPTGDKGQAGEKPAETLASAPSEPTGGVVEPAAEAPTQVEPAATPAVEPATPAEPTTRIEPTTPIERSDPAPAATTTAPPAVSSAPSTPSTPAEPAEPAFLGETPVIDVSHDDDHDDHDHDHDELPPAEPDRYSTLFPLVGALVGLTVVAVLLLVALGLPAVKSGPHAVPIGVAGSKNITDQLTTIFTSGENTSFDVKVFTKESDLRDAIENREIYGGMSVDGQGASMLVSSAASKASADALNGIANSLSQQVQTQIPVRDVVPLPSKDADGRGLLAAGVPLGLASVLPALLLTWMYRRRVMAQVAGAVGASVLIGLALSAIFDFVLGTTAGSNFLLVSVGLAAGVLSVSLLLIGLYWVGGRIAAGLGAAFLLLFAQPLSGIANGGPEWLPKPWGELGQLLPPGATGWLLRSNAYFDGSGYGSSLLVLGGWALIGVLLIGFGLLINGQPPSSAPIDPDEPTPSDDEQAEAKAPAGVV